MSENFIYYFAYGSNLLFERFSYYIKGGVYPATKKTHDGCSKDKNYHFDPNKPIKHIAEGLNLYFGNISNSWGNQGVAFVEIAKDCRVLGRLYKVTLDQFEDIRKQEGISDKWYGIIIKEKVLGFYEGIPIWTITQDKAYKDTKSPSDSYIEIIKRGLKETGYNEAEISFYENQIFPKNHDN